MGNQRSILDYLMMVKELASGKMTREEFKRIRNEGTEEELEAAVEKMMAAGGYENLE